MWGCVYVHTHYTWIECRLHNPELIYHITCTLTLGNMMLTRMFHLTSAAAARDAGSWKVVPWKCQSQRVTNHLCRQLGIPMIHLSFQDNLQFWRAPFFNEISFYWRRLFFIVWIWESIFTHKVLSVFFFVWSFSLRVCRWPHTSSINASLKIKSPKY